MFGNLNQSSAFDGILIDARNERPLVIWDEHSPDEEQDDRADGPYVVTLFGERVPVGQLKPGRRRFGRRR